MAFEMMNHLLKSGHTNLQVTYGCSVYFASPHNLTFVLLFEEEEEEKKLDTRHQKKYSSMHEHLHSLMTAVLNASQGDCWKWNFSSGPGNWTIWVNNSPFERSISSMWISHFKKLFFFFQFLVTRISVQWFCTNNDKVRILAP